MSANILVDRLLTENPAWVEEVILGMALHESAAFTVIAKICYPLGDAGVWSQAFDFPVNQMAFRIIYFLRGGLHPDKQPRTIPKEALIDQILVMREAGHIDSAMERDLHTRVQKWYTAAFAVTVHMYSKHQLLPRWLKGRALTNVQTQLSLGKQANDSSHTIMDRLRSELSLLDELDTEVEDPSMFFYDINRVLDEALVMTPLMIPFRPLEQALGTPLLLGESTLLAAIKGCGKTVMACQLAGLAGKSQIPTLLISTEENPQQLMMRAMAATAHLDIGALRGNTTLQATANGQTGVMPTINSSLRQIFQTLAPETRVKVMETIELLQHNLAIYHWPSKGGGVVAHIDKVLDHYQSRYGSLPKLILFDWIGGALSADDNKDLRLRYNDAMNYLVDIAKNNFLHSFAFCQLDAKAIDKVTVGMRDISESKSLPDRCTNFLALTGLLYRDSKKDGTATTPTGASTQADYDKSPVFSKLQFLVCEKSRLGVPGRVRIERRFAQQRFVEYSTEAAEAGYSNQPGSSKPVIKRDTIHTTNFNQDKLS